MVNKKGLGAYYEISSAGTAAYHEGEPANSKSRNVAEAHGVKLQSRAQKIHPDDFEYYDLILAMDDSNLQDLKKTNTVKGADEKLMLFRAFDTEATKDDLDVPDPYYGGMRGFEDVFEMVSRSCDVLIDHLEKSRN
jgi:protein-tyrosine phosphatase